MPCKMQIKPHSFATQKAKSITTTEDAYTSIIPSLPDDISLRILAYLPRMSYCRLSSVCRAWRDAMRPNGPVIATRRRLNLWEAWIVFVSERDEDFQFLLVDPAHHGCLKLVRPLPEPPSPIFFYPDPMAAGSEILMPAPFDLAQAIFQDYFDSDTLYCFDVQNMEWTDPISFLTQGPHQKCLSHFSCATLDGYLYVVGGDVDGIATKAARLDIASRTWEALPDLTEERLHASAVVLQGCVFIVGGFCQSRFSHRIAHSGEIWDPNSRQWILVPELWPANIFGMQLHRPCIAVVNDRLYALRLESPGMRQELMYYEDASKLWILMAKVSFSELVESKCAFRVLNEHPWRMVGVTDSLFVFCCAEPLAGTKSEDALFYMVALYVKPTLSEPLTWGIWPLAYPADYRAQPLILHV